MIISQPTIVCFMFWVTIQRDQDHSPHGQVNQSSGVAHPGPLPSLCSPSGGPRASSVCAVSKAAVFG